MYSAQADPLNYLAVRERARERRRLAQEGLAQDMPALPLMPSAPADVVAFDFTYPNPSSGPVNGGCPSGYAAMFSAAARRLPLAQPFTYDAALGRYVYDPRGGNALHCHRVATATPAVIAEAAKPTVMDRAIVEVAAASKAAVDAARGAAAGFGDLFGGWLPWIVGGVLAVGATVTLLPALARGR